MDESSTLESVANEYTIVDLDMEAKELVIEPVKTTKYYDDGSTSEVIESEITLITDEEEEGPHFLILVALASILTLPYVWFILPAFVKNGTPYIVTAKLSVFIIEAA